jgi:hypothetical protein
VPPGYFKRRTARRRTINVIAGRLENCLPDIRRIYRTSELANNDATPSGIFVRLVLVAHTPFIRHVCGMCGVCFHTMLTPLVHHFARVAIHRMTGTPPSTTCVIVLMLCTIGGEALRLAVLSVGCRTRVRTRHCHFLCLLHFPRGTCMQHPRLAKTAKPGCSRMVGMLHIWKVEMLS